MIVTDPFLATSSLLPLSRHRMCEEGKKNKSCGGEEREKGCKKKFHACFNGRNEGGRRHR